MLLNRSTYVILSTASLALHLICFHLSSFLLQITSNRSEQKKFSTWRRLWTSLAESEKELGLDISDAQIAEMKAHLEDIDYVAAASEEKKRRHDVMAHIHVFSLAAPLAGPIIHLGATSAFVQDNTDLIVMRDGMEILLPKVRKKGGTDRWIQ